MDSRRFTHANCCAFPLFHAFLSFRKHLLFARSQALLSHTPLPMPVMSFDTFCENGFTAAYQHFEAFAGVVIGLEGSWLNTRVR